MKLIQDIIPVVGLAGIIPLCLGILKFITMLNLYPVEKIFNSNEKNLMIRISKALLWAIPLSFLIRSLLKIFAPIEVDFSQILELEIAYFSISYLTSVLLTIQISTSFFPDVFGKYAYYINHPDFGKMYISRILNKDEVILFTNKKIYMDSNNPSTFIMKKEVLKTFEIKQEKEKNMIPLFFNLLKKRGTTKRKKKVNKIKQKPSLRKRRKTKTNTNLNIRRSYYRKRKNIY